MKFIKNKVFGQKGVDAGGKWRAGTRETEVRLDGWCEGGLGEQRNDGELFLQFIPTASCNGIPPLLR